MHIGLLSDKYPPDQGGLAVSAHRLARGLIAAGHRVNACIVSYSLAPGRVKQVFVDDVPVTLVGRHERAEDTLADWFAAVRDLHQRDPFSLLHGYYAVQAGFITAYAGRYLDRPSVVSVRGNDLDRAIFKPSSAAHILWALSHASAVTAVSHDLARSARAFAPAQMVDVIHNSVDPALFAPADPDPDLMQQINPDGLPLVGFVGEARIKKGIGVLLPAFAQVAAQLPARLLLIGGVRKDAKDLFKVFQRQHPNLPITEIPYTALPALPAFYNLLDVLVLPSLRDGLPNALLEGMACECAVIGTRVGGLPDVLSDGATGLLIPPGDAAALTTVLLGLLRDPDRRRALGQAARQHVSGHFTLEREVGANLALYQRLINSA